MQVAWRGARTKTERRINRSVNPNMVMVTVNVNADWCLEPEQWKMNQFARLTRLTTECRLNADRKISMEFSYSHQSLGLKNFTWSMEFTRHRVPNLSYRRTAMQMVPPVSREGHCWIRALRPNAVNQFRLGFGSPNLRTIGKLKDAEVVKCR
jgi:hypothetical protein